MRVRYSEIFYSFQGEAELAGTPAVWLRLFGCNLECNGFGQDNPSDPSTYELPYKDHDLIDIEQLEDLPVFDKGCDSSYSWSTKYKHLAHDSGVSELADKLLAELPYGRFVHPITHQPQMLAITGGEPMMQQNKIKSLVNELVIRGQTPPLVTVETNATRPLKSELRDYLTHFYSQFEDTRWHWAMSPKLFHTSGEKDAVNLDVIFDYMDVPGSTSILKFVCNGTEESWSELDSYVDEIIFWCEKSNTKAPDIWVMPVGATKEQQESISKIAVDAMRKGYKVATRNHSYVFGNAIGT